MFKTFPWWGQQTVQVENQFHSWHLQDAIFQNPSLFLFLRCHTTRKDYTKRVTLVYLYHVNRWDTHKKMLIAKLDFIQVCRLSLNFYNNKLPRLNGSWPKHHVDILIKDYNWFEDKMLKDQKAQDELTGGPIGKWTKWPRTQWEGT